MKLPPEAPLHARRALLAVLVLVLIPLAWLGSLDTLAKEYVETGLKRALVTFAAARAANAVISVIQETTISVAPAGLGVTSSPGQALDPVNDLVEQFSTLMLAAAVSLGVQALLMSVASVAAVSAAVTAALLAWAFFAWRERPGPAWLPRIVVLLLFIRFAVPLAALASEAAFRAAMAAPYAEAQKQVDNTGQVLLGISAEPAPAKEEGFMDRARRFLSDERQSIGAKVQELRSRAEELIRHLITLAAVFFLQTIALPLVFMWLTFRLLGATMRWRA